MADQTPDPASFHKPSESEAIQSGPSNDGRVTHLPPPVPTAGWLEELQRTVRWFLGLLLVLVGGWLFIFLGYLAGSALEIKSPEVGAGFAGILSLGYFLLLERNFWLSRFMGLRLLPGFPPWASALVLWVFGVPGLFFRSTQTAPAQEQAPANAPTGSDATDSFREIIETVVFVVVLVLMLKSFVAEAFVIPTGSMAETLLGFQKIVECPDCGVLFPVNCSVEVEQPEEFVARRVPVRSCVCPNCRKPIQFIYPNEEMQVDPRQGRIANPGCSTGDRVLVAKFLYDFVPRLPDRLDVVVFKFPGDTPGKPFPWESGPVNRHVPVNYIKRLIGLPGETIAIHRGKLFYLTSDKSPHYTDLEGEENSAPVSLLDLWRKKYMRADDPKAIRLFEEGAFQIVRKSPRSLLAMKRLVYDHDHPATDPELQDRKYRRWVALDSDWKEQGVQGFRADAEESGSFRRLVYRHVLRPSATPREGAPPDGEPQLITDFIGYNTQNGHTPGENWASDLILECDATVDSPTGELALELSRGPERFQARFDLSTGFCTLYRIKGDQEEKLDSVAARVKGKGTYRVRLANVDDRLLVWVNNRLPFGDQGVPYTSPRPLVPMKENDLDQPASIAVRGATVSVSHLKLFRDTYYTTAKSHPQSADVPSPGFQPGKPDTWKALADTPTVTFYVQPGHFLCLGDNSPESSDGRTWGLVPERLMLGKAMMVYYPFYFLSKVNRAGRIR